MFSKLFLTARMYISGICNLHWQHISHWTPTTIFLSMSVLFSHSALLEDPHHRLIYIIYWRHSQKRGGWTIQIIYHGIYEHQEQYWPHNISLRYSRCNLSSLGVQRVSIISSLFVRDTLFHFEILPLTPIASRLFKVLNEVMCQSISCNQGSSFP